MDTETELLNPCINRQLNCLYKLAELIESEHISIDQILESFVTIVSESMQNSDYISVEAIIENKCFRTKTFKECRTSISNKIYINGEAAGSLTVYLDRSESGTELSFNQEERILVNYLSERIGRVIQRYKIQNELDVIREELKSRNLQLQNKNNLLSEIIEQIQFNNQKEKDKILQNFEKQIFPIIHKMKTAHDLKPYLAVLESSLLEIASDYGFTLKSSYSRLSPKEIEVCNFLKYGKSSKEIGELLNISHKTVNKHRDNIRIKLGLKNRHINLSTFLNQI